MGDLHEQAARHLPPLTVLYHPCTPGPGAVLTGGNHGARLPSATWSTPQGCNEPRWVPTCPLATRVGEALVLFWNARPEPMAMIQLARELYSKDGTNPNWMEVPYFRRARQRLIGARRPGPPIPQTWQLGGHLHRHQGTHHRAGRGRPARRPVQHGPDRRRGPAVDRAGLHRLIDQPQPANTQSRP